MISRILVVPTFYLPEVWNGIDEHLLTLSRHLDRESFELVLVRRASDGPQTETVARRACLDMVDGPPHGMPFIAHVKAFRRLYRETRADLVHIHSPAAGGEARSALAARISGIPSLLTVHQFQPERQRLRSRLVNRATQAALLGGTIAVSRDVRHSLRAHSGMTGKGINVVPNGIDAPAAADSHLVGQPGTDHVRLVCLSRLSPEKGVDTLLRAFAVVARQRTGVCLDIAGDGPERATLEQSARELGLDGRVRFLGFVKDAPRVLASADVFVHTPRYEGLPLAIAEAMAASLPVIVAPAPGGIRDLVVDGETGLIAKDRSAEAVSAAILRLVDAPWERIRMGANGHERWQSHFTGERMSRQTEDIYRELLGAKGAGSRLVRTN